LSGCPRYLEDLFQATVRKPFSREQRRACSCLVEKADGCFFGGFWERRRAARRGIQKRAGVADQAGWKKTEGSKARKEKDRGKDEDKR
jgi:hypothetical protein